MKPTNFKILHNIFECICTILLAWLCSLLTNAQQFSILCKLFTTWLHIFTTETCLSKHESTFDDDDATTTAAATTITAVVIVTGYITTLLRFTIISRNLRVTVAKTTTTMKAMARTTTLKGRSRDDSYSLLFSLRLLLHVFPLHSQWAVYTLFTFYNLSKHFKPCQFHNDVHLTNIVVYLLQRFSSLLSI